MVNFLNVQFKAMDEVNSFGIFFWTDSSESLLSPRHALFKAAKQKLEHWLSVNGHCFTRAQGLAKKMRSGEYSQPEDELQPQEQDMEEMVELSPRKPEPAQPLSSGLSAKDSAGLNSLMQDLQDDEFELKDEDFQTPDDLVQLANSSSLSAPTSLAGQKLQQQQQQQSAPPKVVPLFSKPQATSRPTTTTITTNRPPQRALSAQFSSSTSPYSLSASSHGYRGSAPSSSSSPYLSSSGTSSSFIVVGHVCSFDTGANDVSTIEIDDEKNLRTAVLDKPSGVINFSREIWKQLSKTKLRFTMRFDRNSESHTTPFRVTRIEPFDPKCKEAMFFPPRH